MSDSSILNAILSSTTSTVKALTTIAENELEILKNQQKQLQQKLMQQEIINSNLYQSLVDSGIIQLNSLRAVATTAKTTVSSVIDIFNYNNRNFLNRNGDLMHSNNQNFHQLKTSSIDNNEPSRGISNSLNSLASILPLNDVFTGMGSVFEKLFGTKFWIYALLALFICIIITFVICFCTYCCCCSKVGRSILCCFKCLSLSSCTNGSSKKKLSNNGNEDGSKCSKCCF